MSVAVNDLVSKGGGSAQAAAAYGGGFLACATRWAAADLARAGRLDEAAALLTGDAAERDAPTADLLARVRAQQGRYAEAATHWTRCLALDESAVGAKHGLARIGRIDPKALARARAAREHSEPESTEALGADAARGAVPAGAAGPTVRATGPVLDTLPPTLVTGAADALVAWTPAAAARFALFDPASLGSDVRAVFTTAGRRIDAKNLAELDRPSSKGVVADCVCRCLAGDGTTLRGTYRVEAILDGAARRVGVRRTFRFEGPSGASAA